VCAKTDQDGRVDGDIIIINEREMNIRNLSVVCNTTVNPVILIRINKGIFVNIRAGYED